MFLHMYDSLYFASRLIQLFYVSLLLYLNVFLVIFLVDDSFILFWLTPTTNFLTHLYF